MCEPVSASIAIASSLASAGMGIAAQKQQTEAKVNAAKFNAKQARDAKKVAASDYRENAIRKASNRAKELADMRTRMYEKSATIEGGDLDFMNEAVGNVQLEMMDDNVRFQRQQAQFENSAFRSDFQAKQAKQAGGFNMLSTAIGGVADVAGAVHGSNLFAKQKAPTIKQQTNNTIS